MCCTWRNSSLMSGRQSELIALHWHSLPGDLTTKKNKKEHFNPTATKGKKRKEKKNSRRGDRSRTRESSRIPP